jgi:predicted transposase YbfD/YdcC
MLVKQNQPGLYQELKYWFDHPHVWRSLDLRTAKQVNKGHGRIEARQITVSAACGYLDWLDVAQVMLFEKRVVHTRTGEVETSQTYAITSLSPKQADATRLLSLRRRHWAIENELHYPRDKWFGEDASRIRSGQAPRMMASLRNLLLNLLRPFGYSSVKHAREFFAAFPLRALGLLELPATAWLE